MEDQKIEEIEPILSTDQENELVKNELALIPAIDKAEIEKVVKPADLIIIGKHKRKVTSFKRKYPAKNFIFNADEPLDKEKYEKALSAWRDIKNYRTKEVVPEFTALKSPHTAVVKYYNDNQNPIVADLKSLELSPGEYVDKYEAAEKAEKDREETEKKQRTERRVAELIESGCVFDGEYYSVGSEEFEVAPISLGMVDINSLTDELYNKILSEIKEKAAIIFTKQKAKEEAAAKKVIDDAAEEKRKSDQLLADQQKVKEQNQRLRSKELKLLGFVLDEVSGNYASNGISISKEQVETLDMDEWEALMNDAEEKIETIKKEATKKELVSKRENELLGIGLTESGLFFSHTYMEQGIWVKKESIATLNEEEWQKIITESKESVERLKEKKINDDRIAHEIANLKKTREEKLASYWQFVTEAEKENIGKIDDAAFDILFNFKKEMYEKKVANDLEISNTNKEKEEREALAKKGDKAMYENFVLKLSEVHVPEVTTEEYKNKVVAITKFLNGLK